MEVLSLSLSLRHPPLSPDTSYVYARSEKLDYHYATSFPITTRTSLAIPLCVFPEPDKAA